MGCKIAIDDPPAHKKPQRLSAPLTKIVTMQDFAMDKLQAKLTKDKVLSPIKINDEAMDCSFILPLRVVETCCAINWISVENEQL